MNIRIMFDNRQWEIEALPNNPIEYSICFELAEIGQVVEHEETLLSQSELLSLTDSILQDGYMHPILATTMNDHYVIADGTHRANALNQIKNLHGLSSLFVPIVNLTCSGYKREAWALVYKNITNNLAEIMNKWDFIELPSIDTQNVLQLFARGDVAAILQVNGTLGYISIPQQPRTQFLEKVKQLSDYTYNPDCFETIKDTINQEDDFIILAPPNDAFHDLDLLVTHPSLRRCKGSRTVIPVRPMFLPVSVSTLEQPIEQCIDSISQQIDDLLESKRAILLWPGNKKLKYCHETYDHFLLVFDDQLIHDSSSDYINSNQYYWEPVNIISAK